MKKTINVLGIAALVLAMVLLMTTCSTGTTDDPQSDCYGTWVLHDPSLILTATISASVLEVETSPQGNYTQYAITNWQAVENTDPDGKADFPSGYRFNRTTIVINGGSGYVGENGIQYMYLSNDKKEMIWGIRQDVHPFGSHFIKQ
jgi:hypothetical protein